MRKKKDWLRVVSQYGLVTLQLKAKLSIVNVVLPMSKENEKTELRNADDEIVRLGFVSAPLVKCVGM